MKLIAATVHSFLQALAGVTEHCETKWPTDFEMQAYCVDQQKEGAGDIYSFMSRYDVELNPGKEVDPSALPPAKLILLSCWTKWDGDYEMIAYCIEQQEKAALRLGKLPRVSSESKPTRSVDRSNNALRKDPKSQIHNPPPENAVIRAQQLLSDLGYFNGEVDGDLRGDTVAAILDYEMENNLEVTGLISDQLVKHMQVTFDRK